MKVLRNRKGFTMIELMIVAIIVAILAVVIIPMMSGNKIRAYATEAEAALGTVRTALRVYHAENDAYPTLTAGSPVVDNIPGIIDGDLDGTYFSDAAYTIASTPATYTVTCDWSATTTDAPQSAKILALPNVASLQTTINQDGYINRTDY